MSPVFTCTCDELFVRALIAVFFSLLSGVSVWEVQVWAERRGAVLCGSLPTDGVRGPGVRAGSVLSHLQGWWVKMMISFNKPFGEQFIPVQSVSQWHWHESPTSASFCSRAPQQELWEQGSKAFISLTQSRQHAALQCVQYLATSDQICLNEVTAKKYG